MSFMSYFLKNSSIRLAVYGVGICASFIVTPHIIQSMGNSVYGVWILIASLISYFFAFNFANSNAISTICAKAHTQKNHTLMQDIFVAAIQLSIIAAFSTLFMALIYYFIADTEYKTYISVSTFTLSLCIFACSIAIYQIINISHGFLVGHMRWSTIALTSMCRVLSSSLGALFLLQPSNSPDTNLMYMTCANSGGWLLEALLNVILAKQYLPKITLQNLWTNPFRSQVFQISKGLFVFNFGTLLHKSTQVYLIGAFLSTTAVAFYGVVSQIISYTNDLLLSAFGILSPYFSKLQAQNNNTESQHTLLTSLFLSYGICSIITLGLIFYGELFFIRWLGEDFKTIQLLLTPMALAALFDLGPMPASGFLVGIQKQQILAKLAIIEGVIIVCASIPMLLIYDLQGIGWTIFTCIFLTRILWLPRKICQLSGIPLRKYYNNIALALIPSCAAQFIFYSFIKDYVTAEYFRIILAGIGQSIVACSVLYMSMKIIAKRNN